MCPPNDEVAKLREYCRLDRLNWEQMAEEMRLESETNNIRQNAGGFSLVNVQWASFATGASAIFVVAIIAVAVIICCWLRAKGQRRSKHRHSQLLSAVTSAIVPGPPSSRSQQLSVLKPQAQTFHPSKKQSGSGLHQVGQAFPGPICLPQESCPPSFPFLNSLPLPRTMGWVNKDIRGIPCAQSGKFPRKRGTPVSIQKNEPEVKRDNGVCSSPYCPRIQ